MFHVAVCDDEPQVCVQLEKMMEQYRVQNGIDLEVNVFYSGEKLYQAISASEEAAPDLIFLDIELKLLSGVDVGRMIREELRDEGIQIVYISAKKGYAMELFEVRPLHFLLKPLDPEKVFAVTDKARELSGRRRRFFEYDMGKEHYRVPLSKILYFESKGRKIRLVAASRPEETEEQFFYGKLAEIARKLSDDDFIQIHQSYLLHDLYVRTYEYNQVTLVNQVTLPISQPYRKSVRETLLRRRE